jgi:3'(2'), 5'-bisphosphate nucleotidase
MVTSSTSPDAGSLTHEVSVAEAIAREAGALIARYVGSGIGVEYKPGDEGPVTRADREANELIVATIARHFPGDGVLSEELPDDGAWLRAERVWMVDPLDGTRDFIRGRAGFAVMIGLVVGEVPVLGVVYQPTTGRLLRAAPGITPERVEADGSRSVLKVSEVHDLTDIRLVASASHRTEAIDRVRARLGVTDELNVGSVGLKLGLIAAGERDLYVNPASKSSLWDCAGPQAILHAAGGRLTDLTGAPLRYRDPDVKNRRGLVASNGVVHAAVVERLAPLFPAGSPGA